MEKRPEAYLRLTGLFFLFDGGDGEDRTPDLLIANQTLSQLSYAPNEGRIITTSERAFHAPGGGSDRRHFVEATLDQTKLCLHQQGISGADKLPEAGDVVADHFADDDAEANLATDGETTADGAMQGIVGHVFNTGPARAAGSGIAGNHVLGVHDVLPVGWGTRLI